jgi:uncharacterized protein (TIGR04255 family)
MATPGLLFPGLKDTYPVRKQRADAELTIAQNEKGAPVWTPRRVERISYSTVDGRSFVQVGPRAVSIHRLRPYERWESFCEQIKGVYAQLLGIVGPTPFERVGLRYINRLDIPGPEINLDEYLMFKPRTGLGVSEPMVDVQMACTFGTGEGVDAYRVVLASLVPDEKGKNSFALDIDYFARVPGAIEHDCALAWVDTAHSKVECVFEGCITDKLRVLFK